MIRPDDITAAILVGGRSSRMGTDKALLKLGNHTFVECIAGEARRAFDRVILIADHHASYAFLQLPSYPDVVPGCGPLGGIHSALVHAATPYVLIVSCDLPLVTSSLMEELAEGAHPDRITGVSDGERMQPLFAIYPTALAPVIENALHAGKRRVIEFLEEQATTVLDFSHHSALLRNINTPEHYQRLLDRLAAR